MKLPENRGRGRNSKELSGHLAEYDMEEERISAGPKQHEIYSLQRIQTKSAGGVGCGEHEGEDH